MAKASSLMRAATGAILLVLVPACSHSSTTAASTTTTRSSTTTVRPPSVPVIVDANPVCDPKDLTTLGVTSCYEKQTVDLDQQINAVAAEIFAQLSPPARERFVKGEQAWLTYRQAVCASRSDQFEGGSEAQVVVAMCAADTDQDHLTDLKGFRTSLQPR